MADDGAAAVAGLRLHLAFRLEPIATGGEAAALPADDADGGAQIALVAIPSGLDRLRPIPSRGGREVSYLLAEDSIVLHAGQLFPATGLPNMRCSGSPATPTWRWTRPPTRTSSKRWPRSWWSGAAAK